MLRVNSPGGGVAACQAMRRDLERFKARTRRPVVACLMDTAAGGAYHLASAADHVIAGPATVTGGLGVVLNLFNLEDLMLQFNIRPRPVKAGELVNMGSFVRHPDEDDEHVKERRAAEARLFQAMADDFHRQFGPVPTRWWCAITAHTTARPIVDVKDVLSPSIALTILMESANYASKLTKI